jgi:hypothetical protein
MRLLIFIFLYKGMDLETLGIPSREDIIRMYCSSSKASTTQLLKQALDWSGFYLAFLYFKNCVIVQGVAQRSKAGVASSATASRVAELLPRIIEMTEIIFKEYPPPELLNPSRL